MPTVILPAPAFPPATTDNMNAPSRLLLFITIVALLLLSSPFRAAALPNWQPLAVYYYRCSSPNQVVKSRNLVDWKPSSICSPGLCCSNLAPSPRCTKEACELVELEMTRDDSGYF
jgi:hypothetical protein